MIQIATDQNQSARLLACGVDPKSADFFWMDDNPPRLTIRTEIIGDNNPYIVAPAWSLSRLLSLLPPTITSSLYEDEDPDGDYDEYDFALLLCPVQKEWHVVYGPTDEDGPYNLYESEDASLIESVVKMIETLVSHKRKLNTI